MDNNRLLSSLFNQNNPSAYQQPQLHSFCLPAELIESIEPLHVYDPTSIYQIQRSKTTTTTSTRDDDDRIIETIDPTKPVATQNLLNFSCTICRIEFDSNDLQRQHFRSDWHRFNLKLTGSSKSPISEPEFISVLEKLQDSLSGSDSDSDSDSVSSDQSNDQPEGFQSNDLQNFGQRTLQDKFDRLLLAHDHHGGSSGLDPSSSKPDGSDETSEINISQLFSSRSPIVWFTISQKSSEIKDQDKNGPDSRDREESRAIVQLGFYRSIFPKTFLLDRGPSTTHHQLGDQYKSELASLQKPFLPSNSQTSPHPIIDHASSPIWTIFMIGGGHFAGMVVSTLPKLRHVGKHKPPEIELVVLHHKTFHRYTTRRKQGGGQATHDAGGKGAAKSAGANLRRYNEQSLVQDIQNLIKSWSDSIQASDLIFIRSSKSNLKIFFKSKNNHQEADNDLEGYKLSRGDSRIRSLPFVTKRPTFNELKRCFTELTRVKIIKTTQEEIRAREAELKLMFEREKAKMELDIKKRQEQQDRAKEEEMERKRREQLKLKSKEDEPLISRWERIIDLVKKGKLEALKEFIHKYGGEGGGADDQTPWFGRIPTDLVPESSRNGCVSLLQIASLSDQSQLVEWMLLEGRCDPTVKGEKGVGRSTAYELAGSRSTRNSFRRVMAKQPNLWDWVGAAKVPSGLTEEMESQQASRGKDRKQRLKEKLKDRDRSRQAEEQEKLRVQAEEERATQLRREEEDRIRRLQSKSLVNRLGGGGGGPVGENSQTRKTNVLTQSIGLNDEQRMRLERERRARAAEARLK